MRMYHSLEEDNGISVAKIANRVNKPKKTTPIEYLKRSYKIKVYFKNVVIYYLIKLYFQKCYY